MADIFEKIKEIFRSKTDDMTVLETAIELENAGIVAYYK